MKITMRAISLGLAGGLFCAASAFAQATAPAMPAKATTADNKPAAGGGAGKVWVNASSKTYHCEGSKFYGKTKVGEYATEAQAKAQGNRGVKGKDCVK